MPRLFILVVCLLLSGHVSAEHPQGSADIVLRNARIINAAGNVMQGGSLVISGDRISAVEPGLTPVRAAVEIDATDLTVMPGLIDAHRHLLIRPDLDSDAALSRWQDEHLQAMLNEYLESGFTTVLSAGDYHPAIIQIKQRLADGTLTGPRILALSVVFTAPGGHPVLTICKNNPWCQQRVAIQVADPDTARATVRDFAKTDIDGLKLIYDGYLGVRLDDSVFAAIADEGRRHSVPVFAHASSVEDMIRVVDLGANRLVHPPYFGSLAGIKAGRTLRDAAVMVTTTVSRPLGLTAPDRVQALANLRQLWDDGVTIAFGTDLQVGPAAGLARETQQLAQVLSPSEIISALTRNAALFLGLGAEIGTLEVGKVADILIVTGDPLNRIEDLANVVMVIRNGAIVVDHR